MSVTGSSRALALVPLLALLAGCGAPAPPEGRELGWEQLRSQGLPQGARLAVWLDPDNDDQESGYLAFVDGDGKAKFYRSRALSSGMLASSRGQLCVSGAQYVHRVGVDGARRWRVLVPGVGGATFSSAQGCTFVFNNGTAAKGYNTDVVATAGNRVIRSRVPIVPIHFGYVAGKVLVSNLASSETYDAWPRLVASDRFGAVREVARWSPGKFPDEETRLESGPRAESEIGLVRRGRWSFLESRPSLQRKGLQELRLTSIDLKTGAHRTVLLRTWRGWFSERDGEPSKIGTACQGFPQEGAMLYTCDGVGGLWEIDPDRGSMRKTGQLSPEVAKADEVVVTASSPSPGADQELTVLAQPGAPGDVVWQRYRLRDGKLMATKKITSLRSMLKDQKLYVDAVATID